MPKEKEVVSKMKTDRRIAFKFHPYNYEGRKHFVEKEEKGIKRRYLIGISSGIMKDGHGERMTMNCIKSMMEQGKSGNILLYAGLHGVNFINDIGILSNSEIINGRDWLTTYRLYDELDNMDQETLGKSDKLWKQVCGLSPYKKPMQKGFSIEGVVPEHQILDKVENEDGSYSNRIINDIILDGTVVVTRPAYEDSVVTAVYKCLGELPPQASIKIKKNLGSLIQSKINEEQRERNFYSKYFEINSVMEEQISKIMKIPDGRNQERLNALFEEYKNIMVNLILQNAEVFQEEEIIIDNNAPREVIVKEERMRHLMKAFTNTMTQLSYKLKAKAGGL